MKICPNCKKEYDDRMAFCAGCGSRLVDMQPTPQQPQQPVQTVSFCMHCGNKMNSNSAFCAACGTPVNAVNMQSVNSTTVKPSINVNEYIDKIKNNDTISVFVETLKKYIVNPLKALDGTVKNCNNWIIEIIPFVSLLISIMVFFICLFTAVLGDIEDTFGIVIVVSICMSIGFVLIPAITTFVVAKLNGKNYDFQGVLAASSLNVCYVIPMFIVAGIVFFIDFSDFGFWVGAALFILAIFCKAFLSISMLNHFVGNVLESVKTFFISTGIATVLNAIVLSICCSILADIIEEIISNLLFSSLW